MTDSETKTTDSGHQSSQSASLDVLYPSSATGEQGAEGGQAGNTVVTGGGKDAEGQQGKDAEGQQGKDAEGQQGKDAEPVEIKISSDYKDHVDTDLVKSFEDFATEAGIGKDQASEFANNFIQQQMDAHQEAMENWLNEAKKDPDIGGKNFEQATELASKALDRFDESGTFRQLLDESGYGNHPEVLKTLYRVGKAMSEADPATGNPAQNRQENIYDQLFPHLNRR